MENKINLNNNKYPALLKKIGREAPKQLYYRGEWSVDGETGIFENCLAVVGSRRMTTAGRQITEKLVGQIVAAGITIVSGFMYGVDATAHKAAVEAGGRTIAVMPCGIERVHPEYQLKLYNDILENNGLIVSEYEGDSQPGYWSYPARNRIVAGLSKAALVIEAGEESGSLITANLAKKFKRKVFAVPGSIASLVSVGTNGLIKSGDAQMVLEAGDILEFFKIKNNFEKKENKLNLNNTEEKIINMLQTEPMEIDLLARNLKIGPAELGKTISIMEIKGQIKKENGKYYVRQLI
jgi:DNA processing protein